MKLYITFCCFYLHYKALWRIWAMTFFYGKFLYSSFYVLATTTTTTGTVSWCARGFLDRLLNKETVTAGLATEEEKEKKKGEFRDLASEQVLLIIVCDRTPVSSSSRQVSTSCASSVTNDTQASNRKRKYTVSESRKAFDAENGPLSTNLPKHFRLTPACQNIKKQDEVNSPSFDDKLTTQLRVISTPNSHALTKLSAVEEILHVTNLDEPPMEKLDASEVPRILTQLIMSENDVKLLGAALLTLCNVVNVMENEVPRFDAILYERPLPRLVELVSSRDAYVQENAIRLLNSIAMRTPQPVLDQNIVQTLLQVTTEKTPMEVLFQVAKMIMNLCAKPAVVHRVVTMETARDILRVFLLALRNKIAQVAAFACNGLVPLLLFASKDKELWSIVLAVLVQPEGVLDVVMGLMTDPKATKTVHGDTTMVLGAVVQSMTQEQVLEWVLQQYKPLPGLLKRVESLTTTGTVRHKRSQEAVKCLFLLSEHHSMRILQAVRSSFEEDEIFFELLEDYFEGSKVPADLKDQAQTLYDRLKEHTKPSGVL